MAYLTVYEILRQHFVLPHDDTRGVLYVPPRDDTRGVKHVPPRFFFVGAGLCRRH